MIRLLALATLPLTLALGCDDPAPRPPPPPGTRPLRAAERRVAIATAGELQKWCFGDCERHLRERVRDGLVRVGPMGNSRTIYGVTGDWIILSEAWFSADTGRRGATIVAALLRKIPGYPMAEWQAPGKE